MVIDRFPNAKPLVTGWAIVLAVCNAMHVSHVDLDMTFIFYKFEAH